MITFLLVFNPFLLPLPVLCVIQISYKSVLSLKIHVSVCTHGLVTKGTVLFYDGSHHTLELKHSVEDRGKNALTLDIFSSG